MRALLFSFLLCAPAAFAAELPYKDTDFGCIDRAAADRFVSDFRVDVESFGGVELCDGHKDTKKLFNDLTLIQQSQFNADAKNPLVPGLVDVDNYYSWMKSQTRGVERGNDVPYATAYNRGGYFTMQDGWAQLSTLGRVGTVIHEARHTAGYPHYACTHGPYAASNTPGCDTSYHQNGAHAVEMEYYARVVLDAKNLNPVYQNMARLMLVARANFVFNESPIRAREALLARAGNKLLLVDGENRFEREVPPVADGARLKRTSFGASFVKDRQSVAVDPYVLSTGGQALADDYSYYKLLPSDREGAPNTILDTEEVDVNNLRFFTVLGSDGKVYSYDFPDGAWFSPSAALAGAAGFATRAPDGSAGLFVVKSDGTVVPMDLSGRQFGNPLRARWENGVRAYAMNGGALVKLGADGSVRDAKGAPVPAFAGQSVSDLVNVPLYDSFEVVP